MLGRSIEEAAMIEEPVDVILDSVERTAPGELAVRVEGLGDEARRCAAG
jgi:hypothetical protein